MIAEIGEQIEAVAALCRKHGVRRLEVFGSAADGTFDPVCSDLDFLVEYQALQPGEKYEAYFGLWEGLEALFGRKVDLVEPGLMTNPYFIRRVNESRRVVYEPEGVPRQLDALVGSGRDPAMPVAGKRRRRTSG